MFAIVIFTRENIFKYDRLAVLTEHTLQRYIEGLFR